jgi:hypothetical protein
MKTQEQSRGAIYIASFLTAAIVVCGVAFFYKLFRFASTIWENGSEMLGFALLPMSNYLLVAAGFLMLLIWAFLKGEFKDIERAKYELLEDNERYEEMDRLWRLKQKGREL